MKSPKETTNTYTCAMCRNEHEKGWSDEEAEAELKENFGPVPVEECAIVCDACFKLILAQEG